MKKIYITGAKRTPMCSLNGAISSLSAPQFAGFAIKAAWQQSLNSASSNNTPSSIIMGNVLMAGQGQAPARQAAHYGGLGWDIPATTINKMCGSGMQALMFMANHLHCYGGVGIAGGMESMSQAPHLLTGLRAATRMGHQKIQDSMFVDGLEDAYEKGALMGVFAERTAKELNISRQSQDEFALASLSRALEAVEYTLDNEITAIQMEHKKSIITIDQDEQLASAKPEKIPYLKPAFAPDGTVTAANSSSISDGAATLILQADQSPPAHARAKLLGQAHHAERPEHFTIAPIGAIQKLLDQLGWSTKDVDLFEVNEAFAVVALAARNHFNIAPERFNIHGGACALGHPVGASGARIVVTLLNALERHNLKRAIAAICIGGGEATAIAIERIG
ncbi:MAG: thiolase family protein [Pseudomonadota bacterium]